MGLPVVGAGAGESWQGFWKKVRSVEEEEGKTTVSGRLGQQRSAISANLQHKPTFRLTERKARVSSILFCLLGKATIVKDQVGTLTSSTAHPLSLPSSGSQRSGSPDCQFWADRGSGRSKISGPQQDHGRHPCPV